MCVVFVNFDNMDAAQKFDFSGIFSEVKIHKITIDPEVDEMEKKFPRSGCMLLTLDSDINHSVNR